MLGEQWSARLEHIEEGVLYQLVSLFTLSKQVIPSRRICTPQLKRPSQMLRSFTQSCSLQNEDLSGLVVAPLHL